MAGQDSKGAFSRLVTYVMPPNSRGPFRTKEKYFIILTLGTFSFICFAAIWFLPEKGSQGGKVKIVSDFKKQVNDAIESIIVPPPPAEKDKKNQNPNVRHNVIERPGEDPHREHEQRELNARIELDEEIERIRLNQDQGVLPKPNFPKKDVEEKKSSSSSVSPIDKDFEKPKGNSCNKIWKLWHRLYYLLFIY